MKYCIFYKIIINLIRLIACTVAIFSHYIKFGFFPDTYSAFFKLINDYEKLRLKSFQIE